MEKLTNRVSKQEGFEDIYKEYAKDFLGEGQLFFYMKRKGMTSFTGVNGVEIRETGDPVYQVPVPDMEKEFGNII